MTVSDRYLLDIWGEKVKERADGICEVSGSVGTQPHHIFSRANKAVRYDVLNGIWLSDEMHRWAEKIGEKAFMAYLVDNKIRDLAWMNELIARKNTVVKFNMDRNLSKKDAHNILKASGIKRPAMYDLGYNNNNCIGCVKGGMGYWNHIRVDFPDVFKKRAEMERVIGASCIKDTFLDELDPERGRTLKPIVESCGIFCELMAI